MTLPDSLFELDSESEAEPELSRVTVLVGAMMLDVGLPGHLSIADVVNDVIDLANDQLLARADPLDVEYDNTAGRWTFARLGGDPIDPNLSLAEVGIYDGDVLAVTEIGAPAAPLLFDDVEGRHDAGRAAGWRRLAENAAPVAWFGLSVAAAVVAALLLDRQAKIGPAAAIATLFVGALCAIAACVLPYRAGDRSNSTLLAAVALPLLFGGSLYVVPDGHGVKALPMALGLAGFIALLVLLISRRGRPLCTAVIASSILTTPAAVAALLWEPNPRAVGAILATASVIVVYLSPRTTIALSKLPIPRVPTAGEPLDDIETQGGTAVEGVNAVGKQVIPTEEGMAERVRRANEYLTGILVAAAAVSVLGCYFAVDVSNGFFWQGTAFAVTVATVLCLRGRSHHDLVQSATLIGAGMLIVLAMIVKTATYLDGWHIEAALMLVALTVLVVLCGLVAPRLEFSPVQRRLVEILEYVAIGLVFPMCFWIVRIYADFRELRL